MINFLANLFQKKTIQNITLFNTLSREKETLIPIRSRHILFYQCGPTVYWTQHIGNLRASVMADIILRTLQYIGYDVKFVRNYTDVGHLVSDRDAGEDKMEKGVKREGLSPTEIANKYIKIFEADNKDLNNLKPSVKPKATEYIKEMQTLIQTLLDKGFAYITPLAIYFDISRVKDYTKLSRQVLEENREGAGNGEVEDPQKKNSADFVIWFFRAGKHENALQYWSSPFSSPLVKNGNGFPGWHSECSAMSKKLLADTIDIHMGGIEHITVHHTNEIAQSESANGVPLAHYWLHNEHLMVNGGKMSKSEGTTFSLAEIKEKGFNPIALRYFYLQAHYRSKQNFTWEALESSQTGYTRLVENVSSLGNNIGKINPVFKQSFTEVISDDFNLSQGLAITFNLLKSDISNEDKLATILDFDKVLGLNLKQALNNAKVKLEIPENIQKLFTERKISREHKDWGKSDQLRDQLLTLGYEIKDTDQGQQINKI